MSQQSATPIPTVTLFGDRQAVAGVIDHTLLRPEVPRLQIIAHCEEAVRYGFKTVCVHPCWTALAVSIARGTPTKVDVPIGFPQGAALTSVKRFEAAEAVKLGASELDMVINLGALKSGDRSFVENDIHAVAEVAHGAGAILKVILETPLLTHQEKIIGCEVSLSAGAEFVKTATGLVGGATVDDVSLMRSVVGDKAGVKASGGIRTASQLQGLITAGANRIGTSAGVKILREFDAL
jgi:deoxyribose-phosphate aldolase